MRTNSRSRGRGLVLAVLTLVVSLPELARAQQTGLFPLAPIKQTAGAMRPGRSDLQNLQASVFRLSPDVLAAVPERLGLPEPRGARQGEIVQGNPAWQTGETAEDDGDEGTEAGRRCDARPARPALPGGGRSPFETDDRQAGAAIATATSQAPLPTPPGDPFELDTSRLPRHRDRVSRSTRPGAASNGPELSAPAEQPGPIQGTARAEMSPPTNPTTADDDGPVLALPRVNLPPVDDAGRSVWNPATAPAANALERHTIAGSSTPRRGLLSGFFNNLGLNWVRR